MPGLIRRTVGPHVQTPAAVGWPVCHPVLLSQTFLSASDRSSTNTSPQRQQSTTNPTLHALSNPFGMLNLAKTSQLMINGRIYAGPSPTCRRIER
ncbi:hypothetical protein K443DRAFT_481964 [Laccaria amethystina LaAM-08-1]|uniref:Uncharacterized protein n=1 Tax=Laccaria amethystina LaAM-08-1 TaxID=1095629 RepID=A0A0C9WHN8_9AGAR|nr:hypothetical protein K443DRAFT_481964 [Laccaria amethystina LaAM-08-1]